MFFYVMVYLVDRLNVSGHEYAQESYEERGHHNFEKKCDAKIYNTNQVFKKISKLVK